MFITALFTTAKYEINPNTPSEDEWIQKMWSTYTMKYYYSAIKNEILLFATTWIEPEFITLSEIIQKQKEKYHMFSLICSN